MAAARTPNGLGGSARAAFFSAAASLAASAFSSAAFFAAAALASASFLAAATFASAARLHLWRYLTTGWRKFASAGVLAAAFGLNGLVFAPDYGWPVALLIGAADILAPLAFVLWRTQRKMQASWIGRLKAPQARFVVGDEVVVGAVGYDQLKGKIDSVHKCGHSTC